MPIDFEPGWLQHTVDHVTTEALARRLIRSAAWALAQNKRIEVIQWRKAASQGGDAHLLRVTKGLHQAEGPLGDLMHMTMKLYIPGSRQGGLVPDTNFTGKFHLYATISNAIPPKGGYLIQPTRLSYDTVGHEFNVGDGFLTAEIPDAAAIGSNLSSRS